VIPEAMQMLAAPVESNLNVFVKLRDAGLARNEQTPPNHRPDTGKNEAQLVEIR
jgi:hypothetical protein